MEFKKKISIISIFILSLTTMTGCGNSDIVDFSEFGSVLLSRSQLESGVEASSEEEAILIPEEASGDEEITERDVINRCTVYSKASENSSILDYLRDGSKISVIGLTDDGTMLKVIYNGRIAYVNPDNVRNATTTNNTDRNRNNNTGNASTNTPSDTPAPAPAPAPNPTPTPDGGGNGGGDNGGEGQDVNPEPEPAPAPEPAPEPEPAPAPEPAPEPIPAPVE